MSLRDALETSLPAARCLPPALPGEWGNGWAEVVGAGPGVLLWLVAVARVGHPGAAL